MAKHAFERQRKHERGWMRHLERSNIFTGCTDILKDALPVGSINMSIVPTSIFLLCWTLLLYERRLESREQRAVI